MSSMNLTPRLLDFFWVKKHHYVFCRRNPPEWESCCTIDHEHWVSGEAVLLLILSEIPLSRAVIVNTIEFGLSRSSKKWP